MEIVEFLFEPIFEVFIDVVTSLLSTIGFIRRCAGAGDPQPSWFDEIDTCSGHFVTLDVAREQWA